MNHNDLLISSLTGPGGLPRQELDDDRAREQGGRGHVRLQRLQRRRIRLQDGIPLNLDPGPHLHREAQGQDRQHQPGGKGFNFI